MATTTLGSLPKETGLIVCCVPDDALPKIASQLAQIPHNWAACTVAHTSGALEANVLNPLANQGAALLSFHPLQTFAKQASPEVFEGIYIGLEGDPLAIQLGEKLAELLGSMPFVLPTGSKPAYHLAAAMASNYLVTLMEAATKALPPLDLPSNNPLHIFQPLVTQTWQNLLNHSPQDALTGPIARGDWHTVEKHLKTLTTLPDGVGRLYRSLGHETIRLAVDAGRLTSKQAEEGYALLAQPPDTWNKDDEAG